jgi:hypothetical protein
MAGKTAAAPAVAPETILARLELRCQQIAFVKDFAESRSSIPTFINVLARAFDCPGSRSKPAIAHGLDEPGHRGKHPALDDDRERHIQSRKERSGIISQPNSKS